MQTIQQQLARQTAEVLSTLYHINIDPTKVAVQDTPPHFSGDFTIVLFPFLKATGKSPDILGKEIGEKLLESAGYVRSYSIVKGFLNLTLSNAFWVGFLKEGVVNTRFGFGQVSGDRQPMLVEYSSPNTNKPLHLGHIRNNLLGHAVAAILEANGNKVIRVNLVNDRGIHICKSMLAWMKYGKGETPEVTGMKGDQLVGSYYVRFDQELKKEIAQLTAKGLTPKEAEQQSVLISEAREMLRLWEEGDEEIRKLWSEMNQWVYVGFDATYERLGIHFDKTYYESDTYLEGKSIVNEGVSRGVLDKREDGSVWIDLSEQGMDEKLLLRSDGTSVYITQDIGTAILRAREYKPEQMIYVVGNEQNYHFEVLVKVLASLGYDVSEKIRHLSYGMVELPSGKMKSREGTVVDADDLMDEMFKTARKVTSALGKWSDEELAEQDALFETLGMGALKYYMLKVDPKKQMLFNPEESIDFNGNTGPFIQYTHARIASLMRKAATMQISNDPDTIDAHYEPDQAEIVLLRHLYRFPSVLKESAESLNPALVANFSYELAKLFNQFYQHLSVLNDPDPGKVAFRVSLSSFTGAVLRNSMGLLGVTLPEQM